MTRAHGTVGLGVALGVAILAGCTGAVPPAATDAVTSRAPTTAAAPSPDGEPTADPSVGGTSPSAAPPASPGPAGETVFAPGAISTDAEEYRLSLTPDGLTAYFARGEGFFPQSRQATIMESHLVDGRWTDAEVAPFSGTYPDLDPWVTPDGASVFFSSIRPVDGEPREDVDLWRVDRAGDGWGEPVHLGAVNSEGDELGPSITADGVLWFASDRPGGSGGFDLYTAEPDGEGFGAPQEVEAINEAIWEFNPAISADGETLVFTSIGRFGGQGLGDLFVSTRPGEEWSAPEPLRVDTPSDEYHGSLSPDETTLFFVRRTGDGDLYQVEWRAP
jgi:hypothetical protein